MLNKRCSQCKVELPIEKFNRDRSRKDGLSSRCRDCNAKQYRAWRDRDPEHAQRLWKQASQRYFAENGIRRKYGISDADRQVLLEAQNGACAICGLPEDQVTGRNPGRLCIDHCHSSGAVRGLLCPPCNTAVGMLGDDPNRAVALAVYLGYPAP